MKQLTLWESPTVLRSAKSKAVPKIRARRKKSSQKPPKRPRPDLDRAWASLGSLELLTAAEKAATCEQRESIADGLTALSIFGPGNATGDDSDILKLSPLEALGLRRGILSGLDAVGPALGGESKVREVAQRLAAEFRRRAGLCVSRAGKWAHRDEC